MKRECKDCLHYGMNDDGDWYCRKHREHVQFINGCDDFWPKDSNPRCDECRFSEPHHTTGGAVVCYHSTTPNDECARADSSFCENWRARERRTSTIGPRGICHPSLCFGNEPERLLMFHVRESDVQAHPRRTLFWLAWVFFRDAIRIYPGYMRSRPDAKAKAKAARQKLHDIMEKAENADKNLTFDGLREAWRDCADCLHDSQQDEVDFCVNCFDSPGRPNFTLKPNATGA